MADKTTFIKIDRNIINWRWFQSPKILSVFLWLLIKANIKEGHFKHDAISRGSLATSNAHIAEGCGITISNVRTALSNLEETGEIKRESRNHYQIITIVNYDSYQLDRSKSIEQIATNLDSNSQATRKQIATIKEYKNIKNGKKEKNKEKKPSPSPLDGVGDVPKAVKLKPIGEGTVDDIPEEFRDFCKTYEEYWGFRNR